MVLDMIAVMPRWYWLIASVLTLFHIIRGTFKERSRIRALPKDAPKPTKLEKWLVHYFQDGLFRGICSVAGFCALAFGIFLANSFTHPIQVSAGAAALIIASFLIGLVGVTGNLPILLLTGRLPDVA